MKYGILTLLLCVFVFVFIGAATVLAEPLSEWGVPRWLGFSGDHSSYWLGIGEGAGETSLTVSMGYGAAAMYETYGYVHSSRPGWYQAWASILKLLYIAVVLLSAFFVFRRKEKKPEVPDFRGMTGPEV